jgi:hypothetical protein
LLQIKAPVRAENVNKIQNAWKTWKAESVLIACISRMKLLAATSEIGNRPSGNRTIPEIAGYVHNPV